MAEPAPAAAVAQALPELADVYWRPVVDERGLRRTGALWTLSAVAHTLPFLAAATVLMLVQPLAFPVALIAVAHAWAIPELYAQRGANVVRPRRREAPDEGRARAERLAVGLLGDLVGHTAGELHARSGLVLEPGRLGVWLVGESGALLVRPGARRVLCYCIRVKKQRPGGGSAPRAEPGLPAGDRIAHLLLALRTDEAGFATVANLAFAGARWRVRRRLDASLRPALDAAATQAARMVASSTPYHRPTTLAA